MQTTRRKFHFTDVLVLNCFLDKIRKLLTYHTPSCSVTVAKLSTLKNSPVFWPTLYIEQWWFWEFVRQVVLGALQSVNTFVRLDQPRLSLEGVFTAHKLN